MPKDEAILHGPPMAKVPDKINAVDDTLGKLLASHDMGDVIISEEDLDIIETLTLQRKYSGKDKKSVEKLWEKYNSRVIKP